MIGIHTPEFAFERDANNIKRLKSIANQPEPKAQKLRMASASLYCYYSSAAGNLKWSGDVQACSTALAFRAVW